MGPEKLKLLKRVREWVAESPGDSPDFLEAVTAGLRSFETVQKNRRNGLAINAIRDLCGIMGKAKLPKYVTVAYIIDVAFHQFPKGVASHSQVEVDFWNKFLALANSEGDVDRHWLADTRGPEYNEWWDRVVIPALKALETA